MALDFQSIIAGANNKLDSTVKGGKNAMDTVFQWAQSLFNQAGEQVNAAFNGSVVGLKVSGIKEMRTAIDTYCDGVEKTLKDIAKDVQANIVLKGASSKALDTFMQAAAVQCQNLVSQLRRFMAKLDEVEKAYKKTDSTLKSELSKESTEAKNSVKAYTYGSDNK